MRRWLRCIVALACCLAGSLPATARDDQRVEAVLMAWYDVSLLLVRHTPTYSPPVASRLFAYLGITAFESVASGGGDLRSLAGQLRELPPLPPRATGKSYDDAIVLNAAMSTVIKELFANTGPTGQRVIGRLTEKLRAEVDATIAGDVIGRSRAYGEAVAAHILAWSKGDGGALIENLGFPTAYELADGPGHWVPTSTIALQQMPLLPDWGSRRTLAMPDGAACPLPPPPAYSEDKSSEFYSEAVEVYDTQRTLSSEQQLIARFWSDDPMLSPTPPGHWISIALDIFSRDHTKFDHRVDILARLGVAMSDAFVGCWNVKYQYDLLRPVTYIRKLIDANWEPLLITPPFPEYPSGHSTLSGAAAEVLTAQLGDNLAFDDQTHVRDAIPVRHFERFWAAAEEAAMSRLYGGIHFRSAVRRGLDQGRCVGGYANALKTKGG